MRGQRGRVEVCLKDAVRQAAYRIIGRLLLGKDAGEGMTESNEKSTGDIQIEGYAVSLEKTGISY